MAAAAPAKVFTEEQLQSEIRKAVEAERRKAEKAASGWEIIAPVANPDHEVWQSRDRDGKLNNPWKAEYAETFGTFVLQVHPTTLKNGVEIAGGQINMFKGKGVTSDENVAKWVARYYGYEVRSLKEKDDTQKALELASQL